MSGNEQLKDPFEIMENELLPVFKEAALIAKKISDNPNYFKDNYKEARRLYAMAVVSLAVTQAVKENNSEEAKKKNIKNLDLLSVRYFYQDDGSLKNKKNIFESPEIKDFILKMEKLHAGFFSDVHIKECLADFKFDAAVDKMYENQPVISSNGKIINWEKAPESHIFKFAVNGITNETIALKMHEKKRNKEEWNTAYPEIVKNCNNETMSKIIEYCKNKQKLSSVNLTRNSQLLTEL